jgi:nucleotidyltransferase/DNA polymerase involved in DNA repair
MKRIILHLDMDAFFAAIEQLDHPEYRGKPVIVGADPKGGRGRGVVSTCSYEARKYGIHSAMPISEAYRRCPDGIFLPVRGKRYGQVSKQVMAIVGEFSPTIEQISIDEAFVDMTGSAHLFGGPKSAALEMKRRIHDQTGLTASVGIAPNKFLAKIASDLQKPDGLVIVPEGREKEFLRPLPIRRLWGVGKKTGEYLERIGIETIGQLAEMPLEDLTKRFGKWGLSLWQLANGIDHRPVSPSRLRKSISVERTFDEDVDDSAVIEKTLFRIAEQLSRDMRREGLKGRTITLKIRLEDFSTFTRSRTLPEWTNSPKVLRAVVMSLLRKFSRGGQRVRLLGIAVSHLNVIAGEQLSIFEDIDPLEERITRLLDDLNQRFGEGTLKRASLTK